MIGTYITEHKEELLMLLRELSLIPAPSFYEQQRAEYCKNWLEGIGAEGVYIDEANNVIFPYGCEGRDDITVFAAHTDTVFPDMEPMEFREDEERIYCPGVGDDTACVAVLLMTVKYFLEKEALEGGRRLQKPVLFVCNSCEEGLGNLTGVRQLMASYAGRVERFVTFDGTINTIAAMCVGSHRYQVEARTQGGHSFNNFGRKNAICALSEIVTQLYAIEVPETEGSITTYNVGIIEGGTSVNTIAQNARMLCEYRSNNKDCLEIMRQKFEKIFEAAKTDEVQLHVKKIGDRPCMGDVDPVKQQELAEICANVVKEAAGIQVRFRSASTDCNIPLSLGIPAVCMGAYLGDGAHTREEYVEKSSLETGLAIAIRTVNALADGEK